MCADDRRCTDATSRGMWAVVMQRADWINQHGSTRRVMWRRSNWCHRMASPSTKPDSRCQVTFVMHCSAGTHPSSRLASHRCRGLFALGSRFSSRVDVGPKGHHRPLPSRPPRATHASYTEVVASGGGRAGKEEERTSRPAAATTA